MLPSYNGRLLIQLHRPIHHLYIHIHDPEVTIFTPTHTTTTTIPTSILTQDHKWAHREIFALLMALTLWGTYWCEGELLIFCTDPQKLQVIVHGRSRNDTILNIARQVWLNTAENDIQLTPILTGDLPAYVTISVDPPVIQLESPFN
jgi:hypothetical protein